MSGALAERVFVHKMEQVGFTDVAVVDRQPFGLSDAALYPLFTPELIDLMRTLLPPDRQREVATAIIVQAQKPVTVQ